MRRLMTIACDGETLGATVDEAEGRTGLLIVSGGTQTRIGAHRGMARLAATVAAAAGFPVLRFDRRGVGDSSGDDPGFADSHADIAAATAAFRAACPHVRRIVGFGLCDGATALALHHAAAGIDELILANPWTVEPQAGLPPPAAISARYTERLFSARAWWRLLTGGIDYRAAARGIASIVRARIGPGADGMSLARSMARALEKGGGHVAILLATKDATAVAFDAEYRGNAFAAVRDGGRVDVHRLPGGSHSFASPDEITWLTGSCVAVLAG